MKGCRIRWNRTGESPDGRVPGMPPMMDAMGAVLTAVSVWEVPSGPDPVLPQLEARAAACPADLFVFPGTPQGESLATRLAFRLGGTAALNVMACRPGPEKGVTITRPAYGGQMQVDAVLVAKPFCLCPAPRGDIRPDAGLAGARYVLAVGSGVGSRKNLDHISACAEDMGFALGVSRPVAMNGWASMDQLIGLSGRVIAPDVCIAAGVSGSPVFCAGIRHARRIIAINTDPAAMIFTGADAGIVDDMHRVIPELARMIRKVRQP